MKTLFAAIISTGAALLIGASAAANVLTFDDPGSGPVFTFYNPTYSEGGLTFTTPYGEAVWLPGPGQGASNGTQYFINGYSALTITKTGGGDFLFNGFDYAQGLYSANTTDPLTVTLNLTGGGTKVITRTSTGFFRTLSAGSTSVSSVVVGGTSGYLGIDNLIFGVVPEPQTWVLMLGGFGLVGAASRRRAGVVTA